MRPFASLFIYNISTYLSQPTCRAWGPIKPKLLFGSGLTFVSVFLFLLISLIFRTSRARFFWKDEHFYLSASARTRPDSTETGEVGKKQG